MEENMSEFVTRAYNKITLDKQKGILTKTSTESRLADEISYYWNIPEELKIYFLYNRMF